MKNSTSFVEASTPSPVLVDVSTPTSDSIEAPRPVQSQGIALVQSQGQPAQDGYSDSYRRQLYRQLTALMRCIVTVHAWTTEDLENVVIALGRALGVNPYGLCAERVVSQRSGRRSHLRSLPNLSDPQVV